MWVLTPPHASENRDKCTCYIESRKTTVWQRERGSHFSVSVDGRGGDQKRRQQKNNLGLFWLLKGQCHEIFDFWFFSWISFPQASEYTFTAISNFFENSRRYSRLKVKFETVLMGHSGAGGKLIHKKNQKQKNSWHCPPNGVMHGTLAQPQVNLRLHCAVFL